MATQIACSHNYRRKDLAEKLRDMSQMIDEVENEIGKLRLKLQDVENFDEKFGKHFPINLATIIVRKYRNRKLSEYDI